MTKKVLTVIAALAFCVGMQAQTLEAETMTCGGQYAAKCSSPFQGVALYSNGDNATGAVSLTKGSGVYKIKVTGASNNGTAAGVALYVDGKKMADMSFSGTEPSVQQVEKKLYLDAPSVEVKLSLENDNGSNDTYIDKIEFEFVKALAVRPTPVLPTQSVWQSGQYRNILQEAGYSQEEINSKLQAIKQQFFEGDAENGRLYYELGTDEAYILDTGNSDVRTEGLSYGMMICVQLNMQTEFDKLWRFTKNHSMHKSGANKGYLAWQLNTDGSIKDGNAAPDGDEYIATALMFAAGRWGNKSTGIDYWKEANYILDNMLSKGHYINSSHVNMFNKDEKQIVFVPYAQSAVHTDPSYHMPAFYELWSKWANNNRQFWKACADKSREMYPLFAHETTGLMPDYAEFSGGPRAGEHAGFRYDAWRCAMHMATDYMWFKGSENEYNQTKKLLDFFNGVGVKNYVALYELNGNPVYGADHSPGLVGCNAVGAMISDQKYAWDFVDDFFEMTFPTGRFRYYDGCLYFLSYLHASGNFKMYKPAEVLTTALDEQYKTDSNGYLVIDDFENVPEGKEYYMHCRDNSSSAATLVADPKNGSNHVVSIEPKSYDDYYYHAFRLPQGKTLGGNYKSIEFDILYDGTSYDNQTLKVFLNDYDQPIHEESTGAKAEQGTWKRISVDVPASNTDNEFVLGLGVRAGSGTCYVDNLKLRPNGAPEPGPGPTPGDTSDSRNGTYFTENSVKYYMIEDFEGKTVGTTTDMQNNGGKATVSGEHKMEGEKALKINIGDAYQANGCYAIDVTLPEGTTLSSNKFTAINFTIYYEAGSIQYKGAEYNSGVKVWLNDINNMIIQHDTKDCIGKTENISVPLNGKFTDTNSFKLLIGGLCSDYANDGIYYIDNIRLVCVNEQGDGPQPETYPADNILSEGAWGFENGQMNGWNSWGENFERTIVEGGYASNYCLKVENKVATDNRWNKQAAYMLNSTLTVGSTYTMTFKAKADVESQAGVTLTMGEDPYTAEQEQAIDLTTDWAEYTYEVTITNEGVNRIIFNLGEAATSYYFDNICLVKKAGDNPGGGQEGPDSDAKKIVLDDFEKYGVGDTPYTVENANGGSASVVSADADNKALNFTTGSYKNEEYLALTFTLPQGKTLSDYDVLTFDYAFAASGYDNKYKEIKVCIDSKNTAVGTIQSQDAPAKWQTMSIALENVQGDNSFTLYIGGINASVLSMNIDNIVIKTSDADTPTNINLQSISNRNAQERFSIGGQRVNGSYHGIVIINGKKVVVK